ERALEPFEFRQLCKAFDREDVPAVDVRHERAARADGEAVDEDRAGPAHLDVARALRTREPVLFAQVVEQKRLRRDVVTDRTSVQVQFDDHEPDGASWVWRSSFRSHACQYSSTRPSWYLAGYI